MQTVLTLLKIDLGISHDKKDTFLQQKIEESMEELKRKGVEIDLESSDDVMLLSDFTAWEYRHRTENIPLAKNLDLRIKNRKTRRRANVI
jgi:hypothetical protein